MKALLVLLFLLVGLHFEIRAQDITRPPTPADRAQIPRMGWQEAAGLIGKALRDGWKPGRGGAAGSSGNSAFQSWLLLWQWCDLLSRSEPDEFARFAGNFLVEEASTEGKRIVFVPPGYAPPEDATPLPFAEVREMVVQDPSQAVRRLAPPGYEISGGILADRLDPEFAATVVADDAFLRQFFGVLAERDLTPSVLDTLNRIWKERKIEWKSYSSLALAIAIVYDQKLPEFWPHSQVPPTAVPISFPDPVGAFDFWVGTNKSGRSLTDLTKLGPDLLKFVVDAPVHFSELEWAQKNARFPRTDWGRAFSSIRYNFGRITSQAYDWDDSPYTLDAIETAGGICVDQAYFAVIAGKARGLPTLFFTGQGVDGGHAWFGYLRSENRWDMDCGRYENQNYAVGEALDPQSWLPISDHDLQSLAKSFRRQTTYVAARNDLVMARMFEDAGDLPKALACAESAIATSPQTPEAWEAVAHLLRRSNAPASRQIAHHEAALKQFQTENDLRFKNQTALAALLRETGEAARAEQLETKIISQNRLKRSDLSVRAGAERLASLIAAGNIDTALREYRGLLSRLGPTAGGNVFYQIVRPLVKELHRTGRSSEALKALNQARTTINPERDSILEQELVKLEASLSSPSTDP